ncbi:hypothetical protein A6R68_02908 [Neotoma lepida]|uniref:Small ribosomal subunit protein uS17 N-terminal domain-containing protein n=1 Tax=Neotoma lepida TaxID=56216 RepID=A0A1A6GSA0_NEOLE|nr:hypothetical protein A6R68_02908 [Neotoma lepida]
MPKETIKGTYIAKKRPFTGNISIRGRILSGVLTKMKMLRTAVVLRDCLDVQIGDIVAMGECRPLSKSLHFDQGTTPWRLLRPKKSPEQIIQ